MSTARSAHIYGKNAIVHLVTAENKYAAMERAMIDSGFIAHVEDAFQSAGVSREHFLIAIKANIMTAAS